MGGERRPGIDCLRMCDHSQGIRLCLEIVGKINMYTSVRAIIDNTVLLSLSMVSSKDTAVCQLNYLQLHKCRV